MEYTELEYKWAADEITVENFNEICFGWEPIKYQKRDPVPDVYYSHGGNVVRHRWSQPAGELTVKLRRDPNSIVDRLEVNIPIGLGAKVNDVTAFLLASGWKRELTLFKDDVHIHWFDERDLTTCIAYYTVARLDEKTQKVVDEKTFIEVEVEHKEGVSGSSQKLLNWWRYKLEGSLGLGDPIQDSLYEIYTGKKYLMETDCGNQQEASNSRPDRRPRGVGRTRRRGSQRTGKSGR